LGRDAEVLEELPVVVGELREREVMAVDEVVERGFVAGPGNAVRGDPAVPALRDQFDRTGFGVADRSSRRPEPQHHGLPGQRRARELLTTEDLRRERQRPCTLARGRTIRGVA
jgi:hypothetical protein